MRSASGSSAYSKTQNKLMDNRRVAGAQRILLEELQNLVPVVAPCGAGRESGGTKAPFFQGEPQAMRLVSTFSLQGASRGMTQILEIFVAPADDGEGVRLLVNEIPYAGPRSGRSNRPHRAWALPAGDRDSEILRAGGSPRLLPLHL